VGSYRRQVTTARLAVVIAVSVAVSVSVAVGLGFVVTLTPAEASGPINWPSYGRDPAHDSYQAAATAITTANAATLKVKWHWSPVPKPPADSLLYSSAITVNGVIYIGADTGDFYALNEVTGKQIWRDVLPFTPGFKTSTVNCPIPSGIQTASNVTKDPVSGALTVYVASGDTYLRALDAATGKLLWKSQIGGSYLQSYFDYSSPTIANGRIYVGISSHCEGGIRGGLAEYDQHMGALLATYYSVPVGSVGGSIWSTAGVSPSGEVFVTTGNARSGSAAGDTLSIVRLDPSTLARQDIWTLTNPPNDEAEFGASPTFFSARIGASTTALVGACNKNGIFYAWNPQHLAAGPVWSRRVGITNQTSTRILDSFCNGPAVWDATHRHLFVGANQPTPTSSANGSAYELNPANGLVVWETNLAVGPVIGAPSLDGSGVLAFPTWTGRSGAVYLLNASNGALLATLDPGIPAYPQPIFADGYLLVAAGSTLTAYGP
jgi:outer membrane protein assembly factor BamB